MAYITLNKKHFFHNLDIIAKQTKSKDKIALVLKDNAYGHGILEIASMAKEYGITKAVVRCEAEAKMVEDFFTYILVLSQIPTQASKKICYAINDLEKIEKYPRGSLVELKVDTGMHRNGIEPQQLQEAFAKIHARGLKLVGVFTHHSNADEDDGKYEQQKSLFETVKKEVIDLVDSYKIALPRFHSCNSAALFREDNFCEDIARVGIVAYGCLKMAKSLVAPACLPVLSLVAEKNSTRKLSQGECVGYGGAYKAEKECYVSNYDIGYGDGLLRVLSFSSYTTPKGVALVGRISMDNSSFLSQEEQLLIFDDASRVASFANTISYEILTSLKPYITRKIVEF
jgi:alanine racemase